MPCNHDAARNLLGIGWVHTVFLLIPGRSTHGHRQAQVRKEWGKQVWGGGSRRGKNREEKKKRCSLGRIVSGWSHFTSRGRESQQCAAQKIQNGIGWRLLGRYFNWKYQPQYKETQFTGQKPILKGIRSERDCLFVAARQFLVIVGRQSSTDDVRRWQNKKKEEGKSVAKGSHQRHVMINGFSWMPPSADSITDGTSKANHNWVQLTQQHWTWPGLKVYCVVGGGDRDGRWPARTVARLIYDKTEVRRLTK